MYNNLKTYTVTDGTLLAGKIESVRSSDTKTILMVYGEDGKLHQFEEQPLWRSKNQTMPGDFYLYFLSSGSGKPIRTSMTESAFETFIKEKTVDEPIVKALIVIPCVNPIVDKINRIKAIAGLDILFEHVDTGLNLTWIDELYDDVQDKDTLLSGSFQFFIVTGTEDAMTSATRRCSNANYFNALVRLTRNTSILSNVTE